MKKPTRVTVLGLGFGLIVVLAIAASFTASRRTHPVAVVAASIPGTPANEVPGKGSVDVPRGEMITLPPFQLETGTIKPGQPVKVGTGVDVVGWVAYDDFNPRQVPTNPALPNPMVPIRDKAGRQIAWWAGPMGWITFDQIRQGFDYDAAWSAWLKGARPT